MVGFPLQDCLFAVIFFFSFITIAFEEAGMLEDDDVRLFLLVVQIY